jgi:hypothetical protein
MNGMSESMGPSNSWLNKEYLVKVMLKQLNLSNDDLEKDVSVIKSKVREHKLDIILEN